MAANGDTKKKDAKKKGKDEQSSELKKPKPLVFESAAD
jgi:hypothetical protein